ncbi:hypothetical protein RJ639_013908 [Escallonia herrerae]|uniref:NB-ARC domain-containing protein n=1 Tax=Escallonia herrerae TaxID=1293975 RepID=A0AA88VHL0_9ASTE|nr:hypothetical protein RJ639_022745 [Escallonia herrerae]KAK3009086.1 hypothetical protein RJ639_013908 [Escallonia herrerae]
MADVAVGILLDTLSRILAEESYLLLGVEYEASLLQSELILCNSFFKSLEGKHDQLAITRDYASRIEELVYQAEDVIDMYVAKSVHVRGFLGKARLKFIQFVIGRTVAKKIMGIKTCLNEIYQDRKKFEIPNAEAIKFPVEGDSLRSRRLRYFEETDAVGFDAEAETIIDQLIKGDAERDIISLVGLRGIGKSSLCGKVYNNLIISQHFDFRAWVCISKLRGVREVLEKIMMDVVELADEIKNMSDSKLRLELYRYLKCTRYLIVLDDLQQSDWWEDLYHLFPRNMYGSRIVLTTHLKEVAQSVMPYFHYLQPLNKEKSWNLMSEKVFHGGECPSELKGVGIQIAAKCEGLPLAILVLGGVLSRTEKTVGGWSNVLSSIATAEETKQLSKVFELGYNSLPHYLSSCFLYLGFFPEGFEISSRHLTRLWIAEGFVPKKEKASLEEVAEEYLEELIDRNLIELAQKKSDGGVKTCRIHDMLRSFCISKAGERRDLEVWGRNVSSLAVKSRRLGIHSNIKEYISSNQSASNLRSLLCFGRDGERVSLKHWNLLYKGYELVRVLDLVSLVVENIPSEIENMNFLRYLTLKSDSARTLPPSIANLRHLQTLAVVAPLIRRPQVNFWMMQSLRHFYFNGDAVVPPENKVNDRDSCLSNLRTLSCISPDSCKGSVLFEMPNLVKLGIYGDFGRHIDSAFETLSGLALQKLKLVRDRRYERLARLPCWQKFPPTLVKVTLSRTQLSVDPMEQLGQLPNLRVLKLIDSAYGGKELNCTSSSFPQLEVLKLVNLEINRWCVSTGSLPSLRSVVINRCEGLAGLPYSLKDMSTLREMQLWWPNNDVLKFAVDLESHKGKGKLKLLIYHAQDGDSVG